MRPAWRLAISSASTRRTRSLLLVATVALSAALIAAVSCAMSSLDFAVQANVLVMVGRADVRISAASGGQYISSRLMETARKWPEVESAVGQLQTSMTLERARPWWGEFPGGAPEGEPVLGIPRRERSLSATAVGLGIVPVDELTVRPRELVEGRWPEAPGEIALDEMLAGRLSRDARAGSVFSQVSRVGRGKGLREEIGTRPPAPPDSAASAQEAERLNRAWDVRPGDEVRWLRLLRKPVTFRVVGIVAQPPLGGKSEAYLLRSELEELIGEPNSLSGIDLVLKEGVDAGAVAATRGRDLPRGAVMRTAEKATSAMQQNLAGNRIGYAVISTMAFLGASFIIMTGLSTAVTERQRELAILRCVGAERFQIGEAQVIIGAIIGVLGALVGVPLGVAIAGGVVGHFEAEIPTGLQVSWGMLAWAGIGSAASGVMGALIPAYMASRTSPLEALSVRGRTVNRLHLVLMTIVGLALISLHMGAIFAPLSTEKVFWLYVCVGVPSLITGYFILSVPVLMALSATIGPLVARLLATPAGVVVGTLRGSPYRFGLTSGAMSFGLAIMVGIWTQGSAVLRDWIDRLEFPEAFVVGLNLSPEAKNTLEALPFVRKTCAITLHPVETGVFGIKGVAAYTSTFIAFEPGPFFDMTKLMWVEGDPETARRRLEEGGAVLVAKEFHAAKGLGVGDMFRCRSGEREAEFEIVGVVNSPGLEIISQYFTIGQDYTEQSVHAVFGSRADLKEKFGSEAIQMIQIGLVDESDPRSVDDDEAVKTIRRELSSAGIYDAGSARKILKDIRGFVKRTLLVSSSIAVFALLVASLGVANIIAAGIAARRFEFGVLRALGAERWLVARIVLAEVLLMAIGACIIGTVSGLQGAVAGERLQKLVVGLDLRVVPPVEAIAGGCGLVVVICVMASLPSLIGLARRAPRELLASVRG